MQKVFTIEERLLDLLSIEPISVFELSKMLKCSYGKIKVALTEMENAKEVFNAYWVHC